MTQPWLTRPAARVIQGIARTCSPDESKMTELLMMRNEIEPINNKIIQLWADEKNHKQEFWPVLYGEFAADGLLTVGLNPSFSEVGIKRLATDEGLSDIAKDPKGFFAWTAPDKSKQEKMVQFESKAREKYNFYEPMRSLITALNKARKDVPGLTWHHIDMFFVRKTDHKELLRSVFVEKFDKEKPELSPFGAFQFEQFLELLKAARPRAVVIYNALASRLYENRRGESCKYSGSHGCHFDTVGGRTVPIFFSGFPTYQDRYTRTRMEWHVHHVLERIHSEGVPPC